MSRYKVPTGRDVVTASRDRIHHIYDTHDTPIVLFSGGKDSQVLLHLAWEVAQERGLKFVNAVFQHDEFILKPTVDFIKHYGSMPWVRMHHMVCPEPGLRYVFDRPIDFKQWDKNNRKLMSPIPEDAIRPKDEIWDIDWWLHEKEEFQCQWFVGKVAMMNGIRASESHFRWRASVNKLVENYVNSSKAYKRATLCKPIYDWGEMDVFKFLKERNLQYCKSYDWQFFAKMKMRMSPSLHPENIRNLKKLRQLDPTFYDRLLEIFPDQVVHDRYGDDRNNEAMREKYGKDWTGIRNYVMEHYEEGKPRNLALHRLDEIIRIADSARTKELNSYPLHYVLRYFMSGKIWKLLLPNHK